MGWVGGFLPRGLEIIFNISLPNLALDYLNKIISTIHSIHYPPSTHPLLPPSHTTIINRNLYSFNAKFPKKSESTLYIHGIIIF
jgi:hypothetical protein